VSSGGIDDNTSFRYALIAGILFIVSFLAWFFGIVVFEGDEWSWQSAYATLGALTSVLLLCSILFTMLGKRDLSRKSLVVGVLLLMGLMLLFAIRTITYQHGYV
jgi:hypothetical protein